MPLTDTQIAFLTRHLGWKPDAAPEAKPATGAARAAMLPIWREAKEIADEGISALQSELRKHDDEELQRIAEFGLNGLTEGNSVGMMKALMTFDGAAPGGLEAARKALLEQIAQYRSFLSGSEMIEIAEDNPFNVPVSIKGPLMAALDDIERAAASPP